MTDRGAEERTPERDALRALNLPDKGECAFVPPKRWRANQPLHGPSDGGYFDRIGRLWKKGRSVTEGQHFEWDVQLPGGSQINVDWTGRITHPRLKTPESTRKRSKRRRKPK